MPMRHERAFNWGRILKASTAVLVAASLAACGASSSSTILTGSSEPKLGAPMATGLVAHSSITANAGAITGSVDSNARAAALNTANGFIAASVPGNTAYKIGPQDVIEVSVFQVPELSRAVQVGDDGTVGLALVGEIRAAGRTAQEIERDLARMLKVKYLQNPQVSVFVKEFNSQRITIEGAVKKTGVYPLRGKTSLLQAVSLAEGLDAIADTAVVVFRQSDQGRMGARFDLADIRAGKMDDPLMQAGDVIVVGTSFWKEQFSNFTRILPMASIFAVL